MLNTVVRKAESVLRFCALASSLVSLSGVVKVSLLIKATLRVSCSSVIWAATHYRTPVVVDDEKC